MARACVLACLSVHAFRVRMPKSQVLWVPALVPEPLQGLQVQKRPLPGDRADHTVYDALPAVATWHRGARPCRMMQVQEPPLLLARAMHAHAQAARQAIVRMHARKTDACRPPASLVDAR